MEARTPNPSPRAVLRSDNDVLDIHNSFDMYIHDIHRYPLLTRTEEQELGKRIVCGLHARQTLATNIDTLSPDTCMELLRQSDDGLEARNTLIQGNLRLVISIAKKFRGFGIPLNDLVEAGNIGLMRSVRKFDFSRDTKFATYATFWIRQAISYSVGQQGHAVHVPVHASEFIHTINAASNRLTQTLGREPTVQEIAEKLPKLTPEQVQEYLDMNKIVFSLQDPVGEDEDQELGDLVATTQDTAPADESRQRMLKKEVRETLTYLPPRLAQVLTLYFGLDDDGRDLTLTEIGEQMGITRERVRQLKSRAIRMLRDSPHIRLRLKNLLEEDAS